MKKLHDLAVELNSNVAQQKWHSAESHRLTKEIVRLRIEILKLERADQELIEAVKNPPESSEDRYALFNQLLKNWGRSGYRDRVKQGIGVKLSSLTPKQRKIATRLADSVKRYPAQDYYQIRKPLKERSIETRYIFNVKKGKWRKR